MSDFYKSTDSPKVWVVKTHMLGEMNARLGVANALGMPYEVIDIPLKPGAAEKIARGEFPPKNDSFDDVNAFVKERFGDSLRTAQWPDMLITSSMHHCDVARKIKQLSGGTVKTVNIMLPKEGYYKDFDLILKPKHIKSTKSQNIVEIPSVPHNMTPEGMEKGKLKWAGQIDFSGKPVIAVMVGGNAKNFIFDRTDARALGRKLKGLAKTYGASFLITDSPRTPVGIMQAISDEMKDVKEVYFHSWKGDDGLPYQGLLASADVMVVTGDSMSMCAEAASTGKQVYVFTTKSCEKVFQNFHEFLFKSNQFKPLGHEIQFNEYPAVNSANIAATKIKQRLCEQVLQF